MTSTNWTIIALVLLGIVYAVVFAVILRNKNNQEQASPLMLLYLSVSALWAAFWFAQELNWLAFMPTELVERLTLYGLLVLALVSFQLNHAFLQSAGRNRRWWVIGILWLAAVILVGEDFFRLGSRLAHPTPAELGFYGIVVGLGYLMVHTTFLLMQTYRQKRRALHRNRLRYWALALNLSTAGGALCLFQHWALGLVFLQLGSLGAAYVMLTYRLPDLRWVGRMFLSYLLTTLLSMIAFLVGMMAAEAFFNAIPGYTSLIGGMVTAILLAALYTPLLRTIQRLVNRLTSNVNYDPRRMVREYSTSISNILDLEYLTTVAVGLISEALEIQRGALYIVHREFGDDRESTGYFYLRPVRGMGKKLSPGLLASESPVANFFLQEHSPLTQYEIDLLPRFSNTGVTERQWLAELDADVYVPVCSKEQWIGLLVLGPKISGDRYFDDDLAMLSTLADQTAVALENARLFEDLRARNKENERLNLDLTSANRELEQLGEAKSDFIDIASHELRTPLTQVRGYNDILGEMIEDGTLHRNPQIGVEITDNIRRASQRLEEIVKTMLDVSQIDTATLSLSLNPLSIGYIIRTAVENWNHALEERKQTLSVEKLEGLPSIMCDGQRLQQAFSCIIQNAIKYTPDGGYIRITGSVLDSDLPTEDQTIQVVISDTGIGISPEHLERIFEKFYRVGDVLLHSSGDTKFKGAGPGLGLTIARGIIEAHGGYVWAESKGLNEDLFPGSAFHVVLPVQPRRGGVTKPEAKVAVGNS